MNLGRDRPEAAVKAADDAVKAKSDAESAELAFETTGERAKLISDYNALRKLTYGTLGKMRHEHPEQPNDFAETFFRHEGKRADDRLSPEQLQMKIDALRAQQSALEKKREAKLAKLKADADAKAEPRAAASGARRQEEAKGRAGRRDQADGG